MEKDKNQTQKIILEKLSEKRTFRLSDLITQIAEKIIPKENQKTRVEYLINRTLKKMHKDKLIAEMSGEQPQFIGLTSAGRHKLMQYYLSEQNHIVPTSWDGKWRIVLLNNTEDDGEMRNSLRYILKKAGFVCIKNAVWISPIPFEHFLENMKENLDLHDEIIIIVSDHLDQRSMESLAKSFSDNLTQHN